MPVRRIVGPKGQVVIPKEIREKAGIRAGTEVLVDFFDDGVVIKKSKPVEKKYVEYFIETPGKKLEHKIDVKELIEEEAFDRLL